MSKVSELNPSSESMAEIRAKTMVKEDVVRETAEALGLRTKKLQRRISWEEFNERWFKGLCMFCNELETPDHHLLHKNSGIFMTDCDEEQSSYDRELVESEVATESIKTEHGTVKREANADMILANLKDESMPHFQVPVSDSKILKNVELKEENSVFKNLEYVVKNEYLDLRFEVEGDVERGQKVQSMEKIRSAHQLFDKMSLRVQSKRRHLKGHKSWRFKFKQRKQHRGKPRIAHKLNYRGNVMYKYLSSSAKGALMKINKFSTTWSTLKDDCFMEDDQVYQETLPPWLLVRFKFWKFKLMNKNLQKMMREHGHSSFLKLKSDVGDDEGMFSGAKAVSRRFLLGIMLGITETDHASEGQQAVFEQILMVNEWLQTSFVIQQVMRNKKIRLSKRWWFKYRFGEEDQGSLQSRTEYSLSRREILTFISQAEALYFESKDWTEKQIPTWQLLKHINISQYKWTQEEPAVIRFLLRRHLYLNLDCEAPELAGRKRNHCCDWFEVQKNLVQQVLLEEVMKVNDQKQQGDCGHYSLLVAATNWSSQMHLWSASYQVWHRWKARCFYVGMISTMRAWLLGEEGFDIGKEMRRVTHEIALEFSYTWTAQIKRKSMAEISWLKTVGEEALKGSRQHIWEFMRNCY